MMAEAGGTKECMQTKGGSCRRMSEATAAGGGQVAGVLAQIGAIQPMASQTPGRHDAIPGKLVRDACRSAPGRCSGRVGWLPAAAEDRVAPRRFVHGMHEADAGL